jgi:hypothetical protein
MPTIESTVNFRPTLSSLNACIESRVKVGFDESVLQGNGLGGLAML